ncbi:DUF4133 domain-containing protein [Pedobacter sp. ASV28]|uniref:DUF4133 domain-containing protein n=1 Tax=Pedobacter sp. ASV28 TaxID=2795123 RepID=UPI0018EC3446|nr:DUF4133 domain-containing protein [Pedobacter sp. ASV28]
MENSVYQINKGINKSIEFKGLKAQYIWYLGAGVVGLLILFAIMYISGINSIVCVAIILVAGVVVVMKVYALSNKYGEHGMMKEMAKRGIPKIIKSSGRNLYYPNSKIKKHTKK